VRLEVSGATIGLGGRHIVEYVDLVVEPGQFVGLLGPNGSGKTTLLRSVYRALRPISGSVQVAGDDVWALSARASALRTAAVLQDGGGDFEFSVRETVQLGRVPHHGLLDRLTAEDAHVVASALRTAGAEHLAERPVRSLSGGERQRVHVARALAQGAPVVVLDEPTNHLDISAQLELLDLLRGLPLTVLAALHDLNLAAAYCDRIYVLKAGRVVAAGPTAEVLTTELVEEVYGVAAHRSTNPLTGRPTLHFGAAMTPTIDATTDGRRT
jgi:iron complex transport system ATP-binding protein